MATANNNNANEVLNHPEQWKTADEPMTTAQDAYLHTLAREAGEEVEDELTKAEAAKKIEELQEETGRGPAKTAASRPRRARQKKAGG